MCIGLQLGPELKKLVDLALCVRPSTEFWKEMDDIGRALPRVAPPPTDDPELEERRRRHDELVAKWAEEDRQRSGQETVLIPPLPPEKVRAWQEADEIKKRASLKIKEMRKRRCVARANCGHGHIQHIRKTEPGNVTDAVFRTRCGHHDCQVCWRYRKIKTIKRGVKALLFHKDGDVRFEKVYVREVPWDDWGLVNKAIRRAYTKACGRLHLRKRGGMCLVVCAKPFKGASAVTAAQAADMFLDQIDTLSVNRHSFRLLGDWADKRERVWQKVGEYQNHELDSVQKAIEELGKKTFRGFERRQEITEDVMWNCTSEDAAKAFFEELRKLCPFLTIEKPDNSSRDKRGQADEEPVCSGAGMSADPSEEWIVDDGGGGSQWM